jgi:hypothetical protein
MKVEAIHGESFATREEMRHAVFEYIEVDYNRTRRHSANVSWFNGNRTFELFMINHYERRRVHAKKALQLQP